MKVTNEQAVGRDVARNFRQLASELETATTDLASVDTRVVALENLGYITGATNTTTQSGIASSTPTDLTGLSVTWDAVAGRRYRISGRVRCTQSTAVGVVEVSITTAANTIIDRDSMTLGVNESASFNPWTIVTPSAGSVTYKMRVTTFSGGGTVGTTLDAEQPSRIMVEDIGLA